jgi:hypothetical protein
MTHSIALSASEQPQAPRVRKQHKEEKFPLTRRADGRYCKKVRGQMHYFKGSAEEALDEWNRTKEALLAGRLPEPKIQASHVSIKYLCNAFLAAKQQKLTSGELSSRSWISYHCTGQRLIRKLGSNRSAASITPGAWTDYRAKLAMTLGPVSLGNEIQRVRTIYKWGYEAGLLEVPMRFGPDFAKPSRKTMRLVIAEKGDKLFTAAEL